VRLYLAVVGDGLTDVDAALHRQTVASARADVLQDAVVHRRLRAEVVGQSREAVRLTGLCRADVVETRNGVAAAIRQTWVGRRDNAEAIEIGSGDFEIVDHGEVLQPTSEVADLDGDAVQ